MSGLRAPLAAAALAWLLAGEAVSQNAPHAFDALRPCVTIDAGDIARLDAGKSVVRVLSEEDGNVAVFGARRVAADGRRLVAWMRRIEELRQSKFVESMGRFSHPPSIDDLSRLSLDRQDLETLRDCTTGKCRAKITAPEVDVLKRELGAANGDGLAVVDRTFRGIVLDRMRAYLSGGHGTLGRYVDDRTPVPVDAVFRSLLERTPCLTGRFAAVAQYLGKSPDTTDAEFESFFYWSKERLGGKPIVSATQVVVAAEQGSAASATVVVSKQLFATHYMNGSLNVTAIVTSGAGSPHYVVIFNRTNVDFLLGFFGGFARMAVERRIKSELPGILDQLARTLERGPPPAHGSRKRSRGTGRTASSGRHPVSLRVSFPSSLLSRDLAHETRGRRFVAVSSDDLDALSNHGR